MPKLLRTFLLGLGILCVLAATASIVVHVVHRPQPLPDGPGPNEGADNPILIIGEEWAPFEYTKDGVVQGLDAEVLKKIFARLQLPYAIKLYPWSRAKLMGERGQADFLISVSYKKSRERFLHYTEDQREFARSGTWPRNYLWNSEYVFFCRKALLPALRYESYAQIREDGYRVGLVRDYSYNPAFRKAGLGDFTADDISSGFQLLAEGKYDLFPADRTVGKAAVQALDLQDQITFLPKVMFAKPYLLPACRHAPRPGLPELMQAIYDELDRMRRSGEYDRIRQRALTGTDKP